MSEITLMLLFTLGVTFLVTSLVFFFLKETIMRKPWNNHNHYHGEQLHDDGYFGPEPVTVCGWCKEAPGERREFYGQVIIDDPVCDSCWQDFLKDHPQFKEHDEDDWRKDR